MKKTGIKYGLITVLIWNILIIVLTISNAAIRGLSYTYFIQDDFGWGAVSFFLILWSLLAFAVGYHARKQYVQEKQWCRQQAIGMDNAEFKKEFRRHYLSKQCKMLSILAILAIPWYVIGYTIDGFTTRDFMIIGVLFILFLLFFMVFRICKRS